jgi:uncharacterized membrane protein YozB (DUF420 family)
MSDQGLIAQGAPSGIRDQRFFTRMAIALAALIVVGFVQFSLRGFVAVASVPWWVHAHGVFMLLWLLAFVTQNVLAERGDFELHRRIGWATTFIVAGTGIFGSIAGYQAVVLNRIPPFFTNSFFLALTQIEIALFVGAVAWAVVMRRNTQWHRRLMLGATVLLMEPALGRLLPMPLLGGMGEWLALVIQLVPIAILARHDRAQLSAIHPATLSSAALVIFSHVAVSALSALPAFAEFADRIAKQ